MAEPNKNPGASGRRVSASPLHGLRCKPGQLAIVTNPPGVVFPEQHRNLLGMIVRVKTLVLFENGTLPAWTYEGRRIPNAFGTALVNSISDFVLMPIADGLLEEDESTEDERHTHSASSMSPHS